MNLYSMAFASKLLLVFKISRIVNLPFLNLCPASTEVCYNPNVQSMT